ncbi:MAG: hypothetical protein KF881_07560 [Acidobacteria bacterium]|nr:hypothetical protein [Acidobacteriota bacterium]
MMVNSRLLNVLEITVLAIALLVLLTTAGLYLSSVSFDRGFIAGEAWSLLIREIPLSEASTEAKENFPIPSERTYQYLGRKYSYSACFILCFLTGWLFTAYYMKYSKTFDNSWFNVQLALSFFIFLAIYQYWSLVAEKRLWSMDAFWNIPLQELARFAYPIDWICLLLLAATMIGVILLHVLRVLEERVSG